ncbi:hypothetical protein CLOM_g15705 [Closterium sp. NIES-68]|nr:hypothetical protein CLOM_g15705 [Closterium sp. NIES-68]GJP77368.1 hypothetical protein CLOP_g7772 [Closterium sp. NIES-67]
MPFIDIFTCIGGFLSGILLGFALLVQPKPSFVGLQRATPAAIDTLMREGRGIPVAMKYTAWQQRIRMAAAAAFLALLSSAFIVLFVINDTASRCLWCHYMACIPTSFWTCDVPTVATSATPVCQVNIVCTGFHKDLLLIR